MASFNKVIIVGNLTRDPELRHTPGGAPVCEIGIACNRKWYDKKTETTKEEVTFVDVTCWGSEATTIDQYMRKGSPILIEGRLQMDSWEDKQTGQKRNKLKVVCERMQMLGSRDESAVHSGPPSQPKSGESINHSPQPEGVDVPF